MAISTAILRDEGVLKRMQGTPLPRWAYVAARIGSTVVIVLLMTVDHARRSASPPTASTSAASTLPGADRRRWCSAPRRSRRSGSGSRGSSPTPRPRRCSSTCSILPLTFISSIWFPTDGMPKALNDIAKLFPIRALADGLQYAFDPRTDGRGLQRPGPADAGDLDRGRDLPDAPVPAPAAGRGAMTRMTRTTARRDRRRGGRPQSSARRPAHARSVDRAHGRAGDRGVRLACVHPLPAGQRDRQARRRRSSTA